MDRVVEQLRTMAPPLAFLLAAVPFSALLDRLGYFDTVVAWVQQRSGGRVPTVALWVLAALTTAVLNLDTTVVLLAPLAVRLARRAGVDPVRLASIPLVLASLASSPLVVSNLTNLLGAARYRADAGQVAAAFGPPTVVAVVVGWWCWRRAAGRGPDRVPGRLDLGAPGPVDAAALRDGSAVVGALLVAFVVGPAVGVEPWVSVLVADVVLAVRLRHLPWRSVPVTTAVGVAAVAALVALVVPADLVAPVVGARSPWGAIGSGLVGGAAANVVDNLPAFLAGTGSVGHLGRGVWAWWWGVNAFAALVPIGALANLLWLRVLADEGHRVPLRRYLALTAPVVVPAAAAGLAVVAVSPWAR